MRGPRSIRRGRFAHMLCCCVVLLLCCIGITVNSNVERSLLAELIAALLLVPMNMDVVGVPCVAVTRCSARHLHMQMRLELSAQRVDSGAGSSAGLEYRM